MRAQQAYTRIMASGGTSNGSGKSHLPPWELKPETVLVRRNQEESLRGSRAPRPLAPPIFATSTYVLENAKEGEILSNTDAAGGYLYSRWGNPTVDGAANVIATLEGAAGTYLYSSGMGAIVAVLVTFLKSGDHTVIGQPCYGGLTSFMNNVLDKFGVEVTWVQGTDIEDFRKAVKSNTKVLYGESPANPTMSILDIEAFGELGRSLPGVMSVMDATFATPYLMQPIKFGVDLVIHSCTKYLAGHTDLVGGAVSYATPELGAQLAHYQLLLGACMSPMDAFLLHRSLKTLAVRMDRHSENAQAVAEFLGSHPKISRVYYPGLPSHPGHEVAKRQMRNFSGVLSFEVKGGLESGIRVAESTKVAVLAVSLGGVETLVEHPASMTHCESYVPVELRKASGITDGLIRLSVGIENVDDLIRDLKQALDRV